MRNHFDLIAPVYDRVMRFPDTADFRCLLKLPTEGMLLDAGGGTGRASCRLAGLTGGTVVADLSFAMLRRARAKGDLLPVRAHSERLPFRKETFSRVMVVDALHHFCDQAEAVADLVRILKPGGRLVIEEFDIGRLSVKAAALAEKMLLMGSRFLRPAVIRDMIEEQGAAAFIRPKGRFSVWIVGDKRKD